MDIVNVKITSCINPECWYSEIIGMVLEVKKTIQDNGLVDYEYHGRYADDRPFNGLLNPKDIVEI